MKKIDIWVEGIADQKFLADVLNVWLGLSFNEKFNCTDSNQQLAVRIRHSNGVSNYNSVDGWQNIKPSFEENNLTGIKNLIIADADEDFTARKEEVKNTVTGVGFDVVNDLFLWPDHQPHPVKGDLENLLEQIIHPSNQPIFDCWNNYETCLKSTPGKSYTTPARKTKVYAYLEALLGETSNEKEKIKERKRDYTNPDHWDLNSPVLQPLKSFLEKHLL